MDDLISRQDAIEAMRDGYGGLLDFKSNGKTIVDSSEEILSKVPSAQKTGTWIDYQKGKWIYAQCNQCGTVWDVKSNYCPNCGAKMEDKP